MNSENAEGNEARVAVVHCKAGKGRSGTVACGYLISEEGWDLETALRRFTERRMRSGFGAGVSIPSQLRWVRYIDRWAKEMGKEYVERPVEIMELHIWGLRDGVKVAIEGFEDEGKKIKCFHLFHRDERTLVDDGKMSAMTEKSPLSASSAWSSSIVLPSPASDPDPSESSTASSSSTAPKRVSAIILRPTEPVILPSSDINIDFERRSKAAYAGWAMVTSIAHVWFNAYFEGGDRVGSGVFETDWDALDGIKGTTKKGVKALDRLKVVWRYPPPPPAKLGTEEAPEVEGAGAALGKTVSQPGPGEPIPESRPADWRGEESGQESDRDRALRDQENIPHLSRSKIEGPSWPHSRGDDTAASTSAKPFHNLSGKTPALDTRK